MRFLLAALLLSAAVLDAQSASPHLPPLDRSLPKRAEAIYRAVAPRVDADAAMEVVTQIAPWRRLAGNPQFDEAMAFIEARLQAAGIATRYDTIASTSQG